MGHGGPGEIQVSGSNVLQERQLRRGSLRHNTSGKFRGVVIY